MSALTVSDVVSTNLLSELNLNPVWEKYRGYLFAGSVVTSLYPFYMTLNGVDLHCVPINDSTTWENQSLNCTEIANGELSSAQTAYVNAKCATDEKLWFQRYAGTIMLAIAIWILIVSSFWLHFKNVKDGTRTFTDACKKIHKISLLREEITKLCSTPLYGRRCEHLSDENAREDLESEMTQPGYSPKAHKAVRDAIRLFAYHIPDRSIFYWYLKRNILLMLFIIIFLSTVGGLIIWNVTHTEQLSKGVTCRTNGKSRISSKEFVCSSNHTETMLAFLGVYFATLILQLLLTIWAIHICNTCDDIGLDVICTNDRRRSVGLLVKFWESARPSQSGLFREIVLHIHSSSYKDELAKNMKSICKNEDHELIRIKSKLFADTSEVISALYEIFLDDSQLRIKMSIQAVKSAQYSMNENVCQNIKNFILEMQEKERVSNELIVNMFKNCDEEDVNHSSSVKECINLHHIEDVSRNAHSNRSILYYAFSKECLSGPHKFAAAKALCRGKDEKELAIYKKLPGNETTEKPLRQYLKEMDLKDDRIEKIMFECKILPTSQQHPGNQSFNVGLGAYSAPSLLTRSDEFRVFAIHSTANTMQSQSVPSVGRYIYDSDATENQNAPTVSTEIPTPHQETIQQPNRVEYVLLLSDDENQTYSDDEYGWNE